MSIYPRKLCVFAFLLLTSLSPQTLAAQAADTLLLHGHILTVDAQDSVAQAAAIRHGIIVKVGTDAEVLKFAGHTAGIRVIDLKGHTATPGLIDTHAHIADGGVDELYGIKLSDATSVTEIVSRVKAAVATAKPGEWVYGSGWDEGKLSEHRYVTATDLDVVSPNNPVWLTHTTGHYGVANSLALKLAHITAATTDPPAGTIDRDAQGNPTGVLKEDSAMDPVKELIPLPSPEQMKQAILYIQKVLLSEGMTSVKDPDISQMNWDAYKSLLDQGQLKERICVLWHAGSTMESAKAALAEVNSVPRLPASLGGDHLLSCGVKLYMDGSGGARTGWMYDDWLRNAATPDVTSSGAPNRGYPQIDPAIYQEMVRLFHKNGVTVGTHAVGDRAMDWVVDTYALVEQEQPRTGLRHSIIHANLPTPHAIDVMGTLQKKYDTGYPELQAEFLWLTRLRRKSLAPTIRTCESATCEITRAFARGFLAPAPGMPRPAFSVFVSCGPVARKAGTVPKINAVVIVMATVNSNSRVSIETLRGIGSSPPETMLRRRRFAMAANAMPSTPPATGSTRLSVMS